MTIIDVINKKYGTNSIFLLGEVLSEVVPVIPTGSLRLDVALGVGGLPRGRIAEIYGPESSGKTTLCQHIAAEVQRQGGKAAFVDVEHALDLDYAELCGVNTDDLYVSQPDTGEMALNIVEMIVRSKEVDLIILDSVAGLVPRAEIEGEMGDSHMALVARLMGQAMRKLSHIVKDSNCVIVFTNQLRDTIGVMFGPNETTTGGKALRYFASVRIDLRKGAPIKDSNDVIGNRVKATIRKNKVAAPYKVAEFEIYYDEGISVVSDLIHYAVQFELIEKAGSWFTIDERRIQGEKNVRQELKSNVDFRKQIENNIRKTLGFPIRGG